MTDIAAMMTAKSVQSAFDKVQKSIAITDSFLKPLITANLTASNGLASAAGKLGFEYHHDKTPLSKVEKRKRSSGGDGDGDDKSGG